MKKAFAAVWSRRPRAPDRVDVRYELKLYDVSAEQGAGWLIIKSVGIKDMEKVGRPLTYTLGGGMGGSVKKQWPILDACVMRLEEGERALFQFYGSDAWLPMREVFGFKEGDAKVGARMELDVKLERLVKCQDVSVRLL